MTVSFWGLTRSGFRLTDSSNSAEVTSGRPDFKLTDGENTFHAEQFAIEAKKTSAQRFFYCFKHFTRMFWGYFTILSIYKECSPIMIEADVEVKTTRYREQMMAFEEGGYAPDIHDFTAPKLDGGKDLLVTPTAYKVNEVEVKRRKTETFFERLGLSTFLFLLPIVLMLISASIRAGTLTMIGIFSSVVLYPLIALIWILWIRNCKRFEEKVKSKVMELNRVISARNY